ncbi:hypothetical protein JG688_00012596 [Phytophthora aleatoria]|uniref:Uncharacterized protein n=1 Tax=Phytophthora aleatoria TaxID=2496075 RepID=A0A8J5IAZ7_9STRA|nr:hypothetical protein JG688_00012596 [Phytophthora aleatoria]
MDLLQAIQNGVLKQKEEEALNPIVFILTAHPRADVSIQPSLYHLHVERLKGGQGTRVTVIDEAQHEVFEPTANVLDDLALLKRKPYLAQFAVWDAKAKSGTNRKTNINVKANIDFHPGQRPLRSQQLLKCLPNRKTTGEALGQSTTKAVHAVTSSKTVSDDVMMEAESKNDETYIGDDPQKERP